MAHLEKKIQSEGRPLASEIYLRGSLSVFALYDLFGEYCKIIKVESIAVRDLYKQSYFS